MSVLLSRMYLFKVYSVCCLLSCSVLSSFANVSVSDELQTYVLPPSSQPTPEHIQYFPRLLKLALEKTGSLGPYQLNTITGPELTTARIMREVREEHEINIFWTMTTNFLEREYRAIDIPLLKGTNGYRIFLIRKGSQHIFNGVQDLEDLRQLKAGQVHDWPDSRVMLDNGLHVITTPTYGNLIPMLLRGRFDYFPRGIYEVHGEAMLYDEIGVEQNLALNYSAPMYFFMNKKNKVMADRVARGLALAIADGSFDELFNSTPGFYDALQVMKNSSRRVFYLENNGE